MELRVEPAVTALVVDYINRMIRIRQQFEPNQLDDPAAVLGKELAALDGLIRPGARIAIAVGSRGISNIAAFVATISAFIKSRGAVPFVVAAMGSHGGATADGQREVLRLNGVAEDTVGAPVRTTMDVVELSQGSLPHRLFMDRHAHESDGVILINRIKPHSAFRGRYESGLMKMALIGLGKLEGALAIHAFGIKGLRELIGPGATRVLATGKILGGVALVENASHHTMVVKVLRADEIPSAEPALLEVASRNMPKLPIGDIDVLIIDRMGKDISGVGIDPNVVGRIGIRSEADPEWPRIKAIVIRDLTDASHGNAIGIGLADVITRRLYDKIDTGDTYRNVITTGFLERAKIPLVADTDREALEIALRSCVGIPPGQERVIRILDTLHLGEMHVSQAVAGELRHSPAIELVGSDADPFDASGSFRAF
jgi:hypothetical protein